MTERKIVPMDPESNWDICPACRADMETLEWISVGLMRSRHNAHKKAEREATDLADGTPAQQDDGIGAERSG